MPGEIARVEQITSGQQISVGGAVAGAALAGPVGMLIGGQRNRITFVVSLRDGCQFLAEGSQNDFQQLLGASMANLTGPSRRSKRRSKRRKSCPHLLHFLLTVLSCGLWLPIWLLHWIICSA